MKGTALGRLRTAALGEGELLHICVVSSVLHRCGNRLGFWAGFGLALFQLLEASDHPGS